MMNKTIILFALFLSSISLSAQDKVCFKIHGIVSETDKVCKVNVRIYKENFTITDSKKVTVYKRYGSEESNNEFIIGKGSFRLDKQATKLYAKKDVRGNIINSDPIYLVTFTKAQEYSLQLNDLVEFEVNRVRKGESILFELTRNHIRLHSVEDQTLYVPKNKNIDFSKEAEELYLKAFLKDIHYTAKEMRKQMEEPIIESGELKGKGLFDEMEAATTKDIYNFFTYIKIRPAKYRGHTWKISEIFATWLHSGSPMPR